MNYFTVGIYKFDEEELQGNNPYNNSEGIPYRGNEDISRAWATAAYQYRLTQLSDQEREEALEAVRP